MKMIDAKFGIEDNAIWKVTPDGTRIAIPEDEPLLLFRGRDRLAVPLLKHYIDLCRQDGATDWQLAQMQQQVDRFQEFADSHPAVMKQPGSTKGY